MRGMSDGVRARSFRFVVARCWVVRVCVFVFRIVVLEKSYFVLRE